MFSLAPICHLISQSVSIVRSIIVRSHQVKGNFSVLEGSSPKYLNLPGGKKKKEQVSVGKKWKEIRGRAKDLSMGKLESCVCDHPVLLHGPMEARFSFSPPSISRYQLQKKKRNWWYVFAWSLETVSMQAPAFLIKGTEQDLNTSYKLCLVLASSSTAWP